MSKELIIAIILGSCLGLAMAFGIWRFTNSFAPDESVTEQLADSNLLPLQQNDAGQTEAQSEGLTIVQPQANAVVTSTPVAVSGITMQNSNVVIVGDDEYIVRTGTGGTFEQEIEVEGGINLIPVFVFAENGQMAQSSVLIVYSNELESVPNATAVLGTVTDITNTSLQVRNADGEISQVALTGETSYVSTVQSTEDIEFADVAIGDYVAALGQMDEDDVLNASRIIVGTPPEESEIVVAYGIVQTLTNSDFIVSNETEEWSIDATGGRATITTFDENGEVTTTRLANAEEGDRIIVIGTMEDDELQATRIHLL